MTVKGYIQLVTKPTVAVEARVADAVWLVLAVEVSVAAKVAVVLEAGEAVKIKKQFKSV